MRVREIIVPGETVKSLKTMSLNSKTYLVNVSLEKIWEIIDLLQLVNRLHKCVYKASEIEKKNPCRKLHSTF